MIKYLIKSLQSNFESKFFTNNEENSGMLTKSNIVIPPILLNVALNLRAEQISFVNDTATSYPSCAPSFLFLHQKPIKDQKVDFQTIDTYKTELYMIPKIDWNQTAFFEGYFWDDFLNNTNVLYLYPDQSIIHLDDLYRLSCYISFHLSIENYHPISFFEVSIEISHDKINWIQIERNYVIPLYWLKGVKANVCILDEQYFYLSKGTIFRFRLKKIS